MNNIRYRQFVKQKDGSYKVVLWGFLNDSVNDGFVDPFCTSDRNDPVRTYPQSFQSTGLHDSKGVEIWRGTTMQHDLTKPSVAVVVWDEELGRWGIEEDNDYAGSSLSDYLIGDHAIVIGNTVENPGLLKEVEK
jgi:hypothetical protein